MSRGASSRRWAVIDEGFFDEWRPEMAWVLGLLFTDGNLRARMGRIPARLTFSQKAPELLEKIKALVRSDTVIHYHPRRTYNGKTAGAVYRIQICNARICDRLLALGLTPRKSLTLAFPKMPADCMRHFVRGCWDGDGSVMRSSDGSRLIAKFGSGSLEFVEGMLHALSEAGLPSRTVYRLKRGGQFVDYYYFVFQRQEDIDRLFRYLYDSVPETLYLGRKHDVFAGYLMPSSS